jgi:RiboL-PSP-HEPN
LHEVLEANLVSTAARQQMDLLLHDAKSLGEAGNRKPNSAYVRAALVVLCASWETYIEDVVTEAIERITEAPDVAPGDLPHGLRSKLAEQAKYKNGDPWRLAGDGWRKCARDLVVAETEQINTPGVERVTKLLSLALGIDDALGQCSWSHMAPDTIKEYLGGKGSGNCEEDRHGLIEIRGEIAHRGTTPGNLNTRGVRDWVHWLARLADQLDKVIRQHVFDMYHLALD